MYAAFPRSDYYAPFDCLWGLGVSSGFPRFYSPPSLTSLTGSPVFTAQDSQQNAVGGVLLRAPSTLCGSPITPEGRSGLPLLPSTYLLCIGSYFRPLPWRFRCDWL